MKTSHGITSFVLTVAGVIIFISSCILLVSDSFSSLSGQIKLIFAIDGIVLGALLYSAGAILEIVSKLNAKIDNLSWNAGSVLCRSCGESVLLEEEEKNNESFICPKCNTLNENR